MNDKNCIVVYSLENGTKLYVSNINMKSYEYKEIHLTDDKMFAKHFDEFTAGNIVLMNWWKHIGTSSVERI